MLEQSTKEVFKILDVNLGELERRLEKINKRARRIGVQEFTLINFGQEDIGDGKYIRRVHQILLVGEAPKLRDWEFLATLDHGNEVGTVVRCLPGVQVDERCRNAEPFCEHCCKNRRRHSTYVVKNSLTGEVKQVGRTCLADFTGVLDPTIICNYAELFILATETIRQVEDLSTSPRDRRFIYLDEYLSFVAEEIVQHGWCGRQQARKLREEGKTEVTATADTAFDRYLRELPSQLGVSAIKIAEDTIKWVREELVNKQEKTEYEHNISVILSSPSVDIKSIGLAASAVYVYRQTISQKVGNSAAASSQHVGEVGGQVELSTTLIDKRPLEGFKGSTSWLHRFVDREGNNLTWFSTKATRMEVGGAYTIGARVKKHDVFKGVSTTLITHVTILSEHV